MLLDKFKSKIENKKYSKEKFTSLFVVAIFLLFILLVTSIFYSYQRGKKSKQKSEEIISKVSDSVKVNLNDLTKEKSIVEFFEAVEIYDRMKDIDKKIKEQGFISKKDSLEIIRLDKEINKILENE